MTNFSNFMTRIMNTLIDARERAVTRRVRQHLLGFSDRQLEDMGFSRDQIARGLKSWRRQAPVEAYCASKAAATQEAKSVTAPANRFEHPGNDDKLAA